ncbi:E3 ubiquitin-protein ligase RNF170 [Tyto alba]|uniref:E3 ubiquitin-protein ligase RNF170 n=1 Tax=Tyto alba TaxID=56313 RepID=UPI001C6765FE|nr:E3 ubiquitin-protein ligase RNF170 [Tyto alba]
MCPDLKRSPFSQKSVTQGTSGLDQFQSLTPDEEPLQIWQPRNHSDFSCPICLQTATFPVETNCGHLFCGSCLITYWKHSPWLAAITCPLCRRKVVLLDNISCEKQQDKPSKQTVHDIRDYNKRFSGQPRPFADYLYDMPLFLTLALRGIFT